MPVQVFGLQSPMLLSLSIQSQVQSCSSALHSEYSRTLHGLSFSTAEEPARKIVTDKSLQSEPLMPTQDSGLQAPVLVCPSQSQRHSGSLALHSEPLRPLQILSLCLGAGDAVVVDVVVDGMVAMPDGWSRHSPVLVVTSHFQVHWRAKSLQSEPLIPAQDCGLQVPARVCWSQSHAQSCFSALQVEPLRPLHGLSLSAVGPIVGAEESLSRHTPILEASSHFQVHCGARSLQSEPLMPSHDFGLQVLTPSHVHSCALARQSEPWRPLHGLSLGLGLSTSRTSPE
mmetsp:Transcript_40435/g.112308  ORF Transcript_40435/g.112308 Transcript_40435/m.112308 type:complete len:285 (+) Transcript_40435:1131-1985(+)